MCLRHPVFISLGEVRGWIVFISVILNLCVFCGLNIDTYVKGDILLDTDPLSRKKLFPMKTSLLVAG